MSDAFFPIEPYTIRPEIAQSFDLYFLQDNEKLMLYCPGGQRAADSELAQNLDSPVEKLLVLKKDWIAYNLYRVDNLDGILEFPRLTAPQKAATIYKSLVFIAEHLFRAPRPELIHRYKKTTQATVRQAALDASVLHQLTGMTAFEFSVHNHSVNVGIYGMGLMREFLDTVPSEDVAAGFFLHDIGKCRVPVEILHKKGPLSRIETHAFRRHVEEGVRILQEAGALNRDAEIIITQHHERDDGSGYPLGLREGAIHVNAKVCAIADVFDNLTVSRPNQRAISLFDAMKIMKTEMFAGLDPVYFQKFVRLFSGR